jgi:hypothetical protein
MRDRTKSAVKWTTTAAAVIWCVIVGWDQFNDLGTFALGQEDFREQAIQKQLKDCKGTFQERYDCKSAILRAHGRDSFFFWAKKYSLTFGPALFFYVAFTFWLRSVETVEEKGRRVRRVERIEARKQKEGRFAREQARRRAVSGQRRQDIKKAEVDAIREEKVRPMTMMVISQNDLWVDGLRRYLWAAGYYIIQSDLRDVFLSYREIGYHVILTETTFKDPDIHPEDVDDEEFPGKPLPLKETLHRLRERKDNVRIIACGPEYANLSPQQFIAAATELGVDAVIEKPFDVNKLIGLLEKLFEVAAQLKAEEKARVDAEKAAAEEAEEEERAAKRAAREKAAEDDVA